MPCSTWFHYNGILISWSFSMKYPLNGAFPGNHRLLTQHCGFRKKKKQTNTYPRLKRTETLWLWPFWLTGARNRPQMMEIQRDKRPESGSMNPGRSTVTRSPPPTHFSFGSNRDLELSGLWCFRLTMVSYKFKKTSCHNSCESPFRKSSSVVQTINQPWLGMRQLLVQTPVMATHGNMSGLTMAFPRCFWTNHLHIPEDHIVSNYIPILSPSFIGISPVRFFIIQDRH